MVSVPTVPAETARTKLEVAAEEVAQGDASAAWDLVATADALALKGRKRRDIMERAYARHAKRMLADELLSEKEEETLLSLARTLQVDVESFFRKYGDLSESLVIARLNDGRLETLSGSSRLGPKPGEVVYAEFTASLLKEVVQREYRGGYSGVSFPLMAGIRFSSGSSRGRSVVVGTKVVSEDTGVLSVSSARTVFVGAKTTIEMPYAKIAALNVFKDGVGFNLTNRKSAPMFRVGSGNIVAAYVNAAAQRGMETPAVASRKRPAVTGPTARRLDPADQDPAVSILRERLARGEITIDEYTDLRRVLTDPDSR